LTKYFTCGEGDTLYTAKDLQRDMILECRPKDNHWSVEQDYPRVQINCLPGQVGNKCDVRRGVSGYLYCS
jgi:hypothetical protein